jgi:hypothetical protein
MKLGGFGGAAMMLSCASAVLLVSLSFAAQDETTLYIFNNSAPSFGNTVTVLDNNKKIAAINRNRYVILQIAPGHHVLRRPVQSKKSKVELDASPGETYYLVGGIYPGMTAKDVALFGATALVEINKEDAQKLLAQMKPQDDK